MNAVARIAAREWKEQLREPASVLAPVATFVVIDGLVAALAIALGRVAAHPAREAILGQLGLAPSVLDEAAGLAVRTHAFLGFTQLIGLCAVNAGQAILHDRQCGTLSFLLLAPVPRPALLTGKLAGAIALPLAAGSAANLAGALALAASAPTAAAGAGVLPGAPAWWVAWALGAPAWCTFVGAVATGIGAISRDVRTAQQSVWLVLLFASVCGAGLLTSQLDDGVLASLGVALVGAVGTALALAATTTALGRDWWR